MKSDSQKMNELAHSSSFLREMTSEESSEMRKIMIEILQTVIEICDREGLTYMMSGGSCLGTIRHQGFIPWDDDLDIMMPRKDYDKLIRLCSEGSLGDDYEFTCPDKSRDSNTVFLKVFRKGTLNVELANISTPFPKGVFIDVFPIDVVPTGRIAQRIKGFISNTIQFLGICSLYGQYPSRQLKEFMQMDCGLATRYKIKSVIGRIISVVPHKTWMYMFDRFVSSSKDGQLWGIPTGRKYYNGEIFNRDTFVPVKTAQFEGITVNIPNDTDSYLRNLYNDYMQIPPIEKRERHFIFDYQGLKDQRKQI